MVDCGIGAAACGAQSPGTNQHPAHPFFASPQHTGAASLRAHTDRSPRWRISSWPTLRRFLPIALPARIEDPSDPESAFSWGHKAFGEFLAARAVLHTERNLSALARLGFETAAPLLTQLMYIAPTRPQRAKAAEVLTYDLKHGAGIVGLLRELLAEFEEAGQGDSVEAAHVKGTLATATYEALGTVNEETNALGKAAVRSLHRDHAIATATAALQCTDGAMMETVADSAV